MCRVKAAKLEKKKMRKNNYGRTNVLKKLWTWEVWQPADFFWADTRCRVAGMGLDQHRLHLWLQLSEGTKEGCRLC